MLGGRVGGLWVGERADPNCGLCLQATLKGPNSETSSCQLLTNKRGNMGQAQACLGGSMAGEGPQSGAPVRWE